MAQPPSDFDFAWQKFRPIIANNHSVFWYVAAWKDCILVRCRIVPLLSVHRLGQIVKNRRLTATSHRQLSRLCVQGVILQQRKHMLCLDFIDPHMQKQKKISHRRKRDTQPESLMSAVRIQQQLHVCLKRYQQWISQSLRICKTIFWIALIMTQLIFSSALMIYLQSVRKFVNRLPTPSVDVRTDRGKQMNCFDPRPR